MCENVGAFSRRGIILLVLVSSVFVKAEDDDATCTSDSCKAKDKPKDCYEHETEDIVEWVFKHGGFIDKRLKIDGGVYGRGFFATEDIPVGDKIVSVPTDLILADGDHPCHTVAKLRDELMKGRCSKYWPYLKFIRDVEIDIPDAWSVEELQILDGLPPGNWRVHTGRMTKDCPDQKVDLPLNDPFAIKALFFYASRAGPQGMQPIFDIFNHGYNSTWHFLEDEKTDLPVHIFKTKFPIKAGSEVFNQFRPGAGPGYDVVKSMMKSGREPDGAPEIFRDYGFIEPPPTMYYFEQGGRKHSFVIEDANFTVSWLPVKKYDFRRFAKDASVFYKGLLAREAAYSDAGIHCVSEEKPCPGVTPRRLALGRVYRETYKAAVKAAHKAASAIARSEKAAPDQTP